MVSSKNYAEIRKIAYFDELNKLASGYVPVKGHSLFDKLSFDIEKNAYAGMRGWVDPRNIRAENDIKKTVIPSAPIAVAPQQQPFTGSRGLPSFNKSPAQQQASTQMAQRGQPIMPPTAEAVGAGPASPAAEEESKNRMVAGTKQRFSQGPATQMRMPAAQVRSIPAAPHKGYHVSTNGIPPTAGRIMGGTRQVNKGVAVAPAAAARPLVAVKSSARTQS